MALTKINASVIANNTIAVGNIADNSVDATKIASNSILTRHIDDAQITTDQILDGTIATADIADDAVTADKLANAINTSIAAKLPLAGGTMTGNLVNGGITINGSGSVISDSSDLGIASGGTLTVDVTSNIVLDAGGGQISFKDDSTEIGVFENSSSDFQIESKVSNKDIKFVGNDNGSAVTALTLDMSEAGAATFNSTGTFGGDLFVTGGQIHTGNTAGDHSEFGTDGSGHTFIDASTAGGNIRLQIAGTDKAVLQADGKLAVTEIRHITAGNLEVGNDDEKIILNASSQNIQFQTGDQERLRIDSEGLKFNGDTHVDNALNDYEEGTWQPGNNGTQFTTRNGSYTKIGDRVFCQFEVIAGSGSSSGDWYGLPYPIRNSSDLGRGGGVVAYHNENGESWHVSTENVNSSTFSIRLGPTQKQLTSGKKAWGFFSYLT